MGRQSKLVQRIEKYSYWTGNDIALELNTRRFLLRKKVAEIEISVKSRVCEFHLLYNNVIEWVNNIAKSYFWPNTELLAYIINNMSFLVWCLCIAYLIVISEISSTPYHNERFIYTVLITYTQTILTFTKLNTLLLYQYSIFLNLMCLFYLQELEVERALEQKRLTDFQGWLSEVRQKRQVTSLKDH